MAEQLKLPFDDVPISCPIQERYHAIAPILAEKTSANQQAETLNLSYSKIMRWLRQFREEGMAGLFDKPNARQPYTPERVIVSLLYFKCCAPKASDFELTKVVKTVTGHHLHHETVKSLLARYFFWRYSEFQNLILYPIPAQLHERRMEMVKLKAQGWSEKTIAFLLKCSRNTVSKWLRRYKIQSKQSANTQKPLLFEHSRKPLRTRRKVYFGTMRAVLELQRKYGYAGWFRIQGYLECDYGIKLSETTIKKIMALNRRLHLAPSRPKVIVVKESKEGPLKSSRPFEHIFVDFRYLDAKPKGIQLYSCLLIEGYSRTILAGSLTRTQDTGVLLRVYYLGLLEFGCWAIVVSDNGGQFLSKAFERVNHRLQIYHHKNDKGHPWQNLIESQFGIQARIGEYGWQRCPTVEEAIELHRQLIYDHNRLPHFAHRYRQDNKHSPLEVLASAHGREIDKADLHRAFSRKCWERKTDAYGFVRINRWKVYVEAGLPKTPVQVTYWDKKLRAEYDTNLLVEYNCKWDNLNQRPKAIAQPQFFETHFQSPQLTLFDPYWLRSAIEIPSPETSSPRPLAVGQQLKLYFGPEIIK